MRLLLDQDVYALTARFLRGQGHDVVTASDLGLSRAPDEQLLQTASAEKRILITRDRDYGNLVFVKALGSGVIYLRILPSDLMQVHQELENVLISYSDAELAKAFVVVGRKGHRIRKID
jgi:predicted nuclease of predicted toxin-antitoxin system